MVSFIHNGSVIASWMGHSFKSRKAQQPRPTFLPWHFQDNFSFEFQAADYQVSTKTLELYANSLKQLFL